MPFDEIAYLSGASLLLFLERLTSIGLEDPYKLYELRFAIDEGGLKFKPNNGPWTPAMGRVVKH